MGDVKASADIETEYLMAKNKNNFDHPAENGVRIKVNISVCVSRYSFSVVFLLDIEHNLFL